MMSNTAGWVGVGVTVALLVFLVAWALTRRWRASRGEDWVTLDVEESNQRDEAAAAVAEPEAAEQQDEPAAEEVDEHVAEQVDEVVTSADPDREAVPTIVELPLPDLPAALLDHDGDLKADDEVVAVIDDRGSIVALSKPARRALDGVLGAPYTELGRIRPVARADAFDEATHPVARALAGQPVDQSPCVLETGSGSVAGLVTTRSVRVDDAGMVLLLVEVAPAT